MDDLPVQARLRHAVPSGWSRVRSVLMLKVERHRLGARVYVLGLRIHEWHLGLAVLVGDAVAFLLQALGVLPALEIALIGIWLVAKDWPDLTADTRDTAAWRLGIHRRPLGLRPFRRLDDVPGLAAFAVAIVAIVDLVSAVTPNVSWRGHVLVHVEPVAAMRAAHALAVPVSFALIVTAYYLLPAALTRALVALALHGRARGLQPRRRGSTSRRPC